MTGALDGGQASPPSAGYDPRVHLVDPLDTAARIMERERIRAMAEGRDDWGTAAIADEDRRFTIPASPTNRRRCSCPCGGRATTVGMANGLAMASGCDWAMRLWVRDVDAYERLRDLVE